MGESYLLKRMFRNVALISGLIEKRHPGQEKTGRQVTVSAPTSSTTSCAATSPTTS